MKYIYLLLVLFFPLFLDAQIISTHAGGGSGSGTGDGGSASSAILHDPIGGFFDKFGNYYFTEGAGGNRVRKINTSGIITTIAGKGTAGFSGDGGPATGAELWVPSSVKLDTSGNIFILDAGNFRLRRIDASTGVINTIAGTGVLASTGDGGPATAATLGNPQDICIDKQGNIYVADFFSDRVRKINTAGIISNFAGRNGVIGYSGDGSRADTCKIGALAGLCIDDIGYIYIADNSNSSVFKVNTSGIIKKIAGTSLGNYIYNGDEIPATTANIDPVKIGVDKFGNLFIAEKANYRVRMVDGWGKIHTVAGIGTIGFSGDGGPATAAQLYYPSGIALDSCGNLYIPEANNNRVRKVTYPFCNYLNVSAPVMQTDAIIYPNPVSEELTINAVLPIEMVFITNTTGSVVLKKECNESKVSIAIGQLPQGVYFVQVNGKYAGRFMKE